MAPTPRLHFTRLDSGEPAPLDAFCGRVLYLEVWGSWCEPCARSLPDAARLRDTLRRADLEVIGISLDEDAAAARAFLATHRVKLPSLWDREGVSLAAFGISGVPTAVLIDRDGRVRDRIEGYNDGARARIRDGVHRLVRERASGHCALATS